MNRVLGLVNRIIDFSGVDGPGNRFVIFLQGCNFKCINCHNPQTIGDCNLCGKCINVCPIGALTLSNKKNEIVYNESICQDCDKCLQICPQSSSPKCYWLEVKKIVEMVGKRKNFLSGITISGGEATQQFEFIFELFQAIKSNQNLASLTTFLDTNGSLSIDKWQRILPVIDGVMVDLKSFNPQAHYDITGQSNKVVLESIEYLAQVNKLYEVRVLILPGFNDNENDLEEMANYLRKIAAEIRIKLIKFRNHGIKNSDYLLFEPTDAKMNNVKDIFLKHNFSSVIIT